MRRRDTFLLAGSALATFALSACEGGSAAAGPTPTPPKRDVKTVAAALQTKTTAMIDAMGSNNQQRISAAKAELDKETIAAEDSLKTESSSPAVNRTNAAVDRIRRALIANDVSLLNQARDLLQQAQQG